MADYYGLRHANLIIEDEEASQIMFQLMDLKPHASFNYTWDDLGITNLMDYCYGDKFCYCPQQKSWYEWRNRWVQLSYDGRLLDSLETLLNVLLLYQKEQAWLIEHDETLSSDKKKEQLSIIQAYEKFLKGLRRRNPMRSIIDLFTVKSYKNLSDFDTNPYILNTKSGAYDLQQGEMVENEAAVRQYAITMQTPAPMFDDYTSVCDRWYEFIDEIMSYDEEKAQFLQRALGYSLLGVNKEECMFIAYGSQSRNGKGTLFTALENALGHGYIRSTSPALICEKRGGVSIDYNAPQPMLTALVGSRIVQMPEAGARDRLDSAAMKALTGRDTLATRALYGDAFTFTPQFTLWLNTNYLPAVNDETVFLSKRMWVIEFNERFDGDDQDNSLKELFADPETFPTILEWLLEGCGDYVRNGLNPPQCVIDATENYRTKNDRIGRFIDERCIKDDKARTQRGQLYQLYRAWCANADNKFRPIGSTTFYDELAIRGYEAKKIRGYWIIKGLGLEAAKSGEKVGHFT